MRGIIPATGGKMGLGFTIIGLLWLVMGCKGSNQHAVSFLTEYRARSLLNTNKAFKDLMKSNSSTIQQC